MEPCEGEEPHKRAEGFSVRPHSAWAPSASVGPLCRRPKCTKGSSRGQSLTKASCQVSSRFTKCNSRNSPRGPSRGRSEVAVGRPCYPFLAVSPLGRPLMCTRHSWMALHDVAWRTETISAAGHRIPRPDRPAEHRHANPSYSADTLQTP